METTMAKLFANSFLDMDDITRCYGENLITDILTAQNKLIKDRVNKYGLKLPPEVLAECVEEVTYLYEQICPHLYTYLKQAKVDDEEHILSLYKFGVTLYFPYGSPEHDVEVINNLRVKYNLAV